MHKKEEAPKNTRIINSSCSACKYTLKKVRTLRVIKELIKFKKPGKYNLRSNSDNLLLEIEKVKTYTTLGDRAFQVAAPKLWTNLPFNIRSSLFLPSFKKPLKTYLFREAFP